MFSLADNFHEWLAKREGLWLNDMNAVIAIVSAERTAEELGCEQELGERASEAGESKAGLQSSTVEILSERNGSARS